jgi:hypothetical protein
MPATKALKSTIKIVRVVSVPVVEVSVLVVPHVKDDTTQATSKATASPNTIIIIVESHHHPRPLEEKCDSLSARVGLSVFIVRVIHVGDAVDPDGIEPKLRENEGVELPFGEPNFGMAGSQNAGVVEMEVGVEVVSVLGSAIRVGVPVADLPDAGGVTVRNGIPSGQVAALHDIQASPFKGRLFESSLIGEPL